MTVFLSKTVKYVRALPRADYASGPFLFQSCTFITAEIKIQAVEKELYVVNCLLTTAAFLMMSHVALVFLL